MWMNSNTVLSHTHIHLTHHKKSIKEKHKILSFYIDWKYRHLQLFWFLKADFEISTQTCELGQVKVWYFVLYIYSYENVILCVNGAPKYMQWKCHSAAYTYVHWCFLPSHWQPSWSKQYIWQSGTKPIPYTFNNIYIKYNILTCPSSQVWAQTTFQWILSANFKVCLQDPEWL